MPRIVRLSASRRAPFSLLSALALANAFASTAALRAADRYWINTAGGNFTGTANWSTTEGGAGGASVPTASDRAYFNGSSPLYTVNFPRELQFPLPVYAMNQIHVYSGNVRFADSGILGSPGTVRAAGATTDVANRALVVGDVASTPATLSTTLAQFEVEAFTLGQLGNGFLEVEGGSFTATGNADMYVGGLKFGNLTVTNGAHMSVANPAARLRAGTFMNAGGFVFISGAGSQLAVAGELELGAGGASLNVSLGGQLMTGGATIEQGPNPLIPNAAGVSTDSVWSNAGDLTLRGDLNIGGTVSVGGHLSVQSTGRLIGSGVINGDVLNLGETWPDGDDKLHIDGNYSQVDGANAGALRIYIPHPTVFGRMDVSGDVTLGGTLRILTDAALQFGQEFDILDWSGDLTGMFTGVEDNLPPQFKWDLSSFPALGVIRVGAEFAADFNIDGHVDHLDLAIWRFGLGAVGNATQLQGDANGDLNVDGRDFLIWQREFGSDATPAVASGENVPEPTAWALWLLAAAIGWAPRTRT